VFSKEILSSWKNTIPKFGNIQINPVTFVPNLNYTQEMKKIFALAFVAGMVTFAACTSKPADESTGDTTSAATTESPMMESDSMATDSTSTMSTDSASSDSVK
jgi:hypothetical protein